MKNNLLKNLLVIFATVFTCFAQAQKVSGTVSDAKGAISGASVTVKGTTTGTQTDFDGKYTINAASTAILVFKYIGLKAQEVKVDGRSTVNVTLQSDEQQLKDVVVIGYGSVRKKDATGAIDQISSKNFDNVSSVSPAQLLRGKVAGLQVTSSSGEPGGALSLRVRGASSFRSGSNALIVVDGIPLDGGNVSSGTSDGGLGSSSSRNPLNFINQNDIESISVLKDASSTAIYGSRGANGVIMITSKKSKSKAPELSYNTSVQFGSYKENNFSLLDGAAFKAAGGSDKLGSYNWKDALLRSAVSTNHDVSFSKSSENSSTRVSLGITNAEGIVKNTGIDKYSATLYNSNDFFDGKLKFETRIGYTNLNDKATLTTNNVGYIGNVIASALYWNPTMNTMTPTGGYTFASDTYLNPEQILNGYDDKAKTNKLIGSLAATLKLTSKLKYKFLLGIENSNSARKNQLLPSININGISTVNAGVVTSGGFAQIQNQDNFNKTFEHTLNYNNDISTNFNLDVIGGYSYYDYNANGNSFFVKNFNPIQLNLVDNLEGSIGKTVDPISWKNRTEVQSFFGRVNATLYQNLILTGTVRYDGSSKLGDSYKYGNFSSAGIAYKVVNNKEGLLNDVKIRGSYGITGNSEFLVNSAIDKTVFNSQGGQNPENAYNADLKWETTTAYGIGIDFELLKNKLTGSLDYFNRDTKDLIYGVPAAAAQPAPFQPKFDNFKQGVLNGKGIELTLNYNVISNDDFKWDVSGNISTLQTEIKEFPDFFIQKTAELNGPGLSGAFSQQLQNGQPMYSYFLPEFLGYDGAGNSQYSAANYVGKQALPKMNVGFSTTFAYKGLDLTASFYGAYGHYIYNNTANALFFKGAIGGGKNISTQAAGTAQAAGDGNPGSTKYLEKGDFLRMGNLTIGYNFKSSLLEKIRVKAARFYVNGSNLLLFTDYTGFDPEVDINKSIDGVPSSGIDYLSYPKEKSIAVGLNLTF